MMFIYIPFFVTALLFQNACSKCIAKRNIEELSNPSPMPMPYPEVDITFVEPMTESPPMYVPEPSNSPMPEVPVPVYPPEAIPEYPDFGVAISITDYVDITNTASAVSPTIIEAPVVVEAPSMTEVPLITAVGFGNDAVSMALTPLTEAADADVALLMFTKVNVI